MVTTRGTTNAAIAEFELDAKEWNLDIDDFDELKLIGQGGEGRVYHAKHIHSGVEVALKRIPHSASWDTLQESRIHCQLQHSNILRMYGMFCDDDEFDDSDDDYDSDYDSQDDDESSKACWIILEYCPQGTMQQVVQTSDIAGGASQLKKEAFCSKAMHGILHAVKYMHEVHHLMHRDIKPINLLWKDGVGPLLADFGMCAKLKVPDEQQQHQGESSAASAAAAAGRNHEFIGTVIYMAPEVLAMEAKYRAAAKTKQQDNGGLGIGSANNNHNKLEPGQVQEEEQVVVHVDDEEWRKGYSYEADCWSLGITLYELLVGKHPFPIQDEEQYTVEVRGYVQNNFSPGAITFPENMSSDAKEFILALLQVDPQKRMTINEALVHPWIVRHVKPSPPTTTATATSNLGKENISKPVNKKQQQRADAKGKKPFASNSDSGGGVVDKDIVKLLGGLDINKV